MGDQNLRETELQLLLDAISSYFGYDFHDYARASMLRRIEKYMKKVNVGQISALIPWFLHDREAFQDFVTDMSVVVTDMFRDPDFFLALRQEVIPILKTYPFIKIWHAGCASGQEVYSLAIILQEEGILDRCQIYATDFNEHALDIARKGIYSQKDLPSYETSHFRAGGRKNLSEYCHQQYDSLKFNNQLIRRITFSSHNLVTDGVFGEMNLILCRNVLIYFNQKLQEKVLKLLLDSLTSRGILCIGRRENLRFNASYQRLEVMNRAQRIFRMKS